MMAAAPSPTSTQPHTILSAASVAVSLKGKNAVAGWRERLSSAAAVLVIVPAEIIDLDSRGVEVITLPRPRWGEVMLVADERRRGSNFHRSESPGPRPGCFCCPACVKLIGPRPTPTSSPGPPRDQDHHCYLLIKGVNGIRYNIRGRRCHALMKLPTDIFTL